MALIYKKSYLKFGFISQEWVLLINVQKCIVFSFEAVNRANISLKLNDEVINFVDTNKY